MTGAYGRVSRLGARGRGHYRGRCAGALTRALGASLLVSAADSADERAEAQP